MRLLPNYREGHPWIPGGYGFVDGRTGRKFDAMSADLKLQAQNVQQHRLSNPHIYPASEPKYLDLDWIMLQIEDFICSGSPQYCGEPTPPRPDPTYDIQLPEKDCECGAREWLPQWCQSCGQPKILSFKCAKCAKKI